MVVSLNKGTLSPFDTEASIARGEVSAHAQHFRWACVARLTEPCIFISFAGNLPKSPLGSAAQLPIEISQERTAKTEKQGDLI